MCRINPIVVGLVVAAAAVGCGRNRAAPAHDVPTPAPPPAFATPTPTTPSVAADSIELGGFPTRLDLPPGTSTALPVHIRRGDYSGAVRVSLVWGTDIVAPSIVIPAGAHDGVLELSSAAGAADPAVRAVRISATSLDAAGATSTQLLEVSRGWEAGDYAGGAHPDCLDPMLASSPGGEAYLVCVRRLRAGTPELDALVVERRNSDGSVDGSFGVGGRIEIDPDAEISFVPAPVVTTSALTIAVDTRRAPSTDGAIVARFDRTGAPIANFGSDGVVHLDGEGPLLAIGVLNDHPDRLTEIGTGCWYCALDLASGESVGAWGTLRDPDDPLLPDWALVTPDRIYARSGTLLERFFANGVLDTGFGELGRLDGNRTYWIGREDGVFTSFGRNVEPVEVYVLKHDRDGVEDRTFGENGAVWDDFILPGHVFEDSKRRVVVAGEQTDDGPGGYAIRRYLPDGTEDETGRFWTSEWPNPDSPIDSFLLDDDRIVVLQDGSLRVVSRE